MSGDGRAVQTSWQRHLGGAARLELVEAVLNMVYMVFDMVLDLFCYFLMSVFVGFDNMVFVL